MSEPVRLSKRVIELMQCSRSQAEQYIEGGWVKVDGIVVEKPQLVVRDERVEVDQGAQLGRVEPATILLHRPAMSADEARAEPVLTAAARSADDRSGVRLLQRHLHHLTPIASLEPAASGLVVLTQNVGLLHTMRRDGERLEQEFLVDVAGELGPGGLRQLVEGLGGDGHGAARTKASWQSEQRLRIVLRSVSPGQLTRACAAVGLTVAAMRRVRLGRVPLARLALGHWRYLDQNERL